MTSVLLVEDDAAIRQNVARLLQLEGYAVRTAADGREGLAQARAAPPDVLITDVNMPGLDGFALLGALRADAAFGATAVLMLTALDDRASMRRGMTAGADDYLAKPFTRDELLEALDGLLRKRGRFEDSVQAALREREETLRQGFSARLDGAPAAPAEPLAPPSGAVVVQQELQATVLVAQIRQFTSMAEKLDSGELAELLSCYFEGSCLPVLGHGGRHLRLLGDRLLAVFADDPARPLPPARRALSAGLSLALAAHAFRGWLAQRFAGRALPPFAIGLGLHAGAVTVCSLGTGAQQEALPVGAAVDMAARLEAASQELGWTVVASTAVLQAAGEGVETGGVTALEVHGRERWMEVAEVVGLVPGPEDRRHGMGPLSERAAEIQEAVRINSELTTRAVKGALRNKLSTIREHRFAPGEPPPRLKGYRLLRKIGSGGMTEVYLAAREEDALPVVLKVLEAAGPDAGEHLSRFIQEYALLSRLEDPHVIRIYDQGFTDDHAYIAMEYFERGDLRGELRAGMGRDRVLEVLAQVARALEVVHAQGIIHRDLKPENIMVRTDGSVALADFGVAKALRREDQVPLSETLHGEVVGTPYYLSPEQAAGDPITPASDLYSLGVMFHEMLTGQRPFQAETLHLLLAYHVTAPTPRLPPPHEELQPLLERLMAKRPQDRFSSAGALLQELRGRWLPGPPA